MKIDFELTAGKNNAASNVFAAIANIASCQGWIASIHSGDHFSLESQAHTEEEIEETLDSFEILLRKLGIPFEITGDAKFTLYARKKPAASALVLH